MSMSEFERQPYKEDREPGLSSISGLYPPADFTEEEQVFAAELHALFSPEAEELPPYYVRTLLDVDDPRFEPTGHGFEQQTSARVFRRLKLRRHLFYTRSSPLSLFRSGLGDASLRRSLLAVVAAFLLVMTLTVAFTGQSFAAGVAVLLRGTHGSGVLPAPQYPANVELSPAGGAIGANLNIKNISLQQTQSQLHFQMYWPNFLPAPYQLEHISLYVGLDQQWADGPMLEFKYSLPQSVAPFAGTGEIWVREFKPRAGVLQVVQNGADLPIGLDQSGQARAIYVDGEWGERGKDVPQWIYGTRSELIYQVGGVLFWIVGDQRDGVGLDQLTSIAAGLTPFTIDPRLRIAGLSMQVTQTNEDDIAGPFSTDVIQVFPNDGTGSPYDINVSSYQPPSG